MKIVYVIDSYGKFSNGTTVTAKRSKEYLESLGHQVSIVSIYETKEAGYYTLKERNIPIVSYFAKKQHMHFSKPNDKILKEAFKGADIIHLFLPYKTSRRAIKIARKMNIPVTSAFHMQPEHITYGMGLGKYGRPLSWFIYKWLNFRFYKHITHIHCPSEFIRDKLNAHKYNNVLHVISNGVSKDFFTNEIREENPNVFNILSIGRYSKEKRQETLLKAIKSSEHKEKIEVTFAGRGPREKKLKKLAKRYNINAKFVFLNKEDLINTIKKSHLYVHPAEAEIEGISALEAISSGLVPIVAKSKDSATAKFTITEKSVYKVRKHKELSKKIDYFINNPKERIKLEAKYKKHMKTFEINNSMKLLEEMFKEAINDYKRNKSTKTKKGKKLKSKLKKNKFKRFFSFIFYYGFVMPILSFYFYLIRGIKIKNKKQLKKIKTGSVFITNHIHKLDSALSGLVMFPKKPIYTSIPQNFERLVIGSLVSALGALPIPINYLETKVFFHELKYQLLNKRYVHFFPEGELITKDKKIRPFKRGAFLLAEEAKVPIVVIKIKFVKKKSKLSFPFFFKDKIEINVSNPIYPNIFLSKKEAIKELQEKAYNTMINL